MEAFANDTNANAHVQENSEYNSIEYSIIGHSGDSAAIPFISFDSQVWDEHTIRNTTGYSREEYKAYINKSNKPHNLFPIPKNEADRMNILSRMVAHAQYCMSGDNTLKATESAIERSLMDIQTHASHDSIEYYTIIISDANFQRYSISPNTLASIMTKYSNISNGIHMILLASMDNEASYIIKELPVGHGHVCLHTSDLPNILKDILTSAIQ